MSKKKLRITDFVSFERVESNVLTERKVQDMVNSQSGGILVRIAATHAGIITGNNTFYLPDRMRKGTSTWTAQYNKPILTHHNREADPIGRVIQARYVDLSNQIGPSFQNSLCKDSALMKDSYHHFNNGMLSPRAEIQFIKDVMYNSGVLEDKNYQGLGYSEIVASITDPAAVQKIKDGRYLTGSVSASTDRAICSVCEADWIIDGRCDHEPGQMYDGLKAFLIAGDFEYEEYSYVNTPADVHSINLEMVADGKVEKINISAKEKSTKMADNETIVKVEDKEPEVVTTTDTTTVTTEPEVTLEPVVTTPEVIADKVEEPAKTEDSAVPAECESCKTAAEKITSLETELKTQKDALLVLRNELKDLCVDLAGMEDQVVDAKKEARTAKTAHLADLQKISKAGQLKDAKELNLADLDDSALDSAIASVDTTNIIDRLSSGLTNSNPEGTVSNPSAIVDNMPAPIKDDNEDVLKFKATYEYLRVNHGVVVADEYKKKMERAGFIS